jgi:hypothetical protein
MTNGEKADVSAAVLTQPSPGTSYVYIPDLGFHSVPTILHSLRQGSTKMHNDCSRL